MEKLRFREFEELEELEELEDELLSFDNPDIDRFDVASFFIVYELNQ